MVLKVGSFTYKVIVMTQELADAIGIWGECDFANKQIRIAAGMCSQQLANTIMHEVTHAIHYQYGLMTGTHVEEVFTTLGTNGLCQFFQDNSDYAQWWIEVNARPTV